MNMQNSLAQRMFLVLGVLLLFGCAQHPTLVESDESLPERETLIDIVRCVAADTALLVQAGLVIEELNQLKVLHARNEGPQPLSISTVQWSLLIDSSTRAFIDADCDYVVHQSSMQRRVVLDETDLRAELMSGKEVRRRFRQGLLNSFSEVSLPILSRDHKHAYVEVTSICGHHLCGAGVAYWLREQGGGWVIVDSRSLWVS
ncbi:MAG: hypothetical protein IPI81_00945 [Flavobacteriales bacterium]|nr:hypothetical protein [Flavobacteriales bacterium]MCC6939498.1 hypothetical protein [Flavobacteriales bacterium]